LDGLADTKKQRPVFRDIMLGVGLFPRLGAYFGATLEGSVAFSSGATTHYLGLSSTPRDRVGEGESNPS